MPVVSEVVGVRQRDAAGPPGKRIGKTSPNAARVSSKAARKIVLHPLVELFDDRHEVLARLREVRELLGEELVPLLEGGELFERERVDPAELGELALGLLQATALLTDRDTDGSARRDSPSPRIRNLSTERAGPDHIPR